MALKYKKKPFALLGINSDGDRSVTAGILKQHKITYRNAVDGTTEGPVAKLYKVTGWPTVYVLDRKGIIRAKFIGVDPDQLTKAVEKELSIP